MVQSLLSYRVLLSNNLFRICDGNNSVLVVDKEYFGFNKSIGGYLDNSQLLLHPRIQSGFQKYEFLMNVVAFSIRDQYLTDLINLKDKLIQYNQCDGLSLRSE